MKQEEEMEAHSTDKYKSWGFGKIANFQQNVKNFVDEMIDEKEKYDRFRDKVGKVKQRLAVKRERVLAVNENRKRRIR